MTYLLNIRQKKRILSPTSGKQWTSVINLLYELKHFYAPVLVQKFGMQDLGNYNIINTFRKLNLC